MLRKLTPHFAIILALMYLVFFCIDRVNTSMNFIDNAITKGLLCALSLLAIAHAVLLISDNRRRAWEAYQKQRESHRRRD